MRLHGTVGGTSCLRAPEEGDRSTPHSKAARAKHSASAPSQEAILAAAASMMRQTELTRRRSTARQRLAE